MEETSGSRNASSAKNPITRRSLLESAALGGLAAAAASVLPASARADDKAPATKGKVKQSICQWCYSKVPLDELAKSGAEMGYKSIELIGPDRWPAVQKHGLICAMVPSHPLHKGLNHKEHHDECLAMIRTSIERSAEVGFPNVITFSGNRAGMPDDMGIENCVIALKKIVGFAEEKKVTICMELLNSKVDHKDYQCDRTPWGVEVVKRVGSPRFKLLYDIYHMQIMEGDVIRTIRENHQYIAHYHTGGNPGRNEIDETQELNYAAVLRAIAETGYDGYVAQEFIPKVPENALASLKKAYQICAV